MAVDQEADAVLDGLAGAVYCTCDICGASWLRSFGAYRTWRDDWCRTCKDMVGTPGWGAFRLYHLGRRTMRRVTSRWK